MQESKKFVSRLLLAVLVIPVQDKGKWQTAEFRGIAANKVEFQKDGIGIHVRKSASPLVYSLDGVKSVKGFRAHLQFSALPLFKKPDMQGEKGQDDFAMRIGFVLPGAKQLKGLDKWMVADWIKKLFAQAPSGMGIDHVHFFNLVQTPLLLGHSRVHPLSDLLVEDFVRLIPRHGPFDFEFNLPQPMNATALWLSADGDDTKSEYDVRITSLELDVE